MKAFKDAGGAMAEGLGLNSAAKAVGNIGKGVEFVAEHPGQALSLAAKTGEYALEHPGDIAKIASKELVHSFTDPKELLINAALIAGTMGTGFAAKEAAEVGIKTGVEVGTKAVAEATAKAGAEAGTKAVAEAGTKAVGEAGAKAAGEAATKAGGEVGRKTLFDSALESGRWNPIQRATTALRERGAQAFLSAGGENPSALRTGIAQLMQGSSGTMPKQLEGVSDTAYKIQKTAWRAKQIEHRADQLHAAGEVTKAAADPTGYALSHAGGGKGGGGGQDATHPISAYGGDPGRSQSFAYGSTTPQGDTTISSVTAPQTEQAPTMRGRISEFNRTGRIGAGSFGMQIRTAGPNGPHFWQGPQREALGGIGMGYDWRVQGPLRPIMEGNKYSYTPPKTPTKGEGGGAEQISGGSVEAKVPAKPIVPMSSMSAKAGLAMEVPKGESKSDESMYDYGGKGGQGRFTFPELSQPSTSTGPRIMQAAGTGADRGGQSGRNESFVSGSVYGVAADTTIGNTTAWNNTGQGSFVFPQLDQPKSQQPTDITEVGNIKPATPLRPLTMPLQNRMMKPRQTLGV
jgi:hypothetical protein